MEKEGLTLRALTELLSLGLAGWLNNLLSSPQRITGVSRGQGGWGMWTLGGLMTQRCSIPIPRQPWESPGEDGHRMITGWSHPACTSLWQSRWLTLALWKCFNLWIKYCFTLCPAAQHNSSIRFHSYNKPKQTAFKLWFQIRLDKERASSVWCSGQFIAPSSASAPWPLRETGFSTSPLQLPLNWVDIRPCICMDNLIA